MIGCGLIGVGHHGRRYLQALLSPNLPYRLVGFARQDINKELPFNASGVRQFGHFSELITDPEVDAIIAVVPPSLHSEICEAAFQAKKPLLLEKPLALRAATAREIAAKAKSVGARVMVAHTLRFDPVSIALKRNIDCIGELALVTVSQRFKKGSAAWWDDAGTLGTTVLVGVHGFDLIRWLCDASIEQVSCMQSRMLTRNAADTFIALCRLSVGGTIGIVDNTRASGGRIERVEVVGSKGVLSADITSRVLTHIRDRQRQTVDIPKAEEQVPACLKAFFLAVERDLEFPVSIEDALAAVETAEACALSHESQAFVMVGA